MYKPNEFIELQVHVYTRRNCVCQYFRLLREKEENDQDAHLLYDFFLVKTCT